MIQAFSSTDGINSPMISRNDALHIQLRLEDVLDSLPFFFGTYGKKARQERVFKSCFTKSSGKTTSTSHCATSRRGAVLSDQKRRTFSSFTEVSVLFGSIAGNASFATGF